MVEISDLSTSTKVFFIILMIYGIVFLFFAKIIMDRKLDCVNLNADFECYEIMGRGSYAHACSTDKWDIKIRCKTGEEDAGS